MSIGLHIGLDTSNYTTSAAAVTPAGEVFCAKRPLQVPQGEKGLRQSDALFCHIRDLPAVVEECMASARERLGEVHLLSVGASVSPRRAEGSYMPCFLAGLGVGRSLASAAGVPFFDLSHQEGHMEAALYGTACEGRDLTDEAFFAFHLSGGTTELLFVRRDGTRFDVSLAAATRDITLGQLLDRCGVALGLPFPAGAHLERLAREGACREKIRIPVREGGICLSGFENQFQKRRESGARPEDLAAYLFAVAAAACRALMEVAEVGERAVLFSGGVSSSTLLREALGEKHRYYAPAALCADNAVGIALLARKGAANG